MPKVTPEHREAMVERIEQATIRAFLAKGVQGASMADILQEAGLSAGALYGYYKSKDDLIAAAAGQVVAARTSEIGDLAEASPLPRPDELVRRIVAGVPAEYLDGGLIMEIWSMVRREPAIGAAARGYFDEIRLALARYLRAYALAAGHHPTQVEEWVEPAARLLVGRCQACLVQISVLGPDLAEDYLESLGRLGFPMPDGRVDLAQPGA